MLFLFFFNFFLILAGSNITKKLLPGPKKVRNVVIVVLLEKKCMFSITLEVDKLTQKMFTETFPFMN